MNYNKKKKILGIYKLRYRMIILFSIFILIPVILSGFYSYWKQAKQIRDDYEIYKERINQQIIKILEDNILNLQSQSLAIFANPDDIFSILTTPEDKIDYSYLSQLNNTKRYFASLINLNPNIRGISLIDTSGIIKQYVGHDVEGINLRTVKEEKWFKTSMSMDGIPYVIQPHYNSFEIANKLTQRKVVSVSRAIMDLNSFEVNGILLIDQDISYLTQLLSNIETDPEEIILIYDGNGDVIYQNNQIDKTEEAKLYTNLPNSTVTEQKNISNKQVLISSGYSDMLSWKIVSIVPMSTIWDKSQYVKRITISSLLILLVVILLVSTFISFFITKSLERLSASIRELEKGNFDTHIIVNGKDEVAQIGHTFNHMVRNLKSLVNKTYKLELLNKQTEISALQSQINPHFLFNTLGSMKSVADREGNSVLAEMIQNLADLFRYSLAKGSEMVSLQQEINYVNKYVILQKLRYGDRFAVQYDIPEQLMSGQIPRLILQPIVENCIKHGFANTIENGLILIAAQTFDKNIILYISDNGNGMKKEVIEKLNLKLSSESQDIGTPYEHIGIYNVNARIKLQFGDGYGLSIYSTENTGTTVKMTLPYNCNY